MSDHPPAHYPSRHAQKSSIDLSLELERQLNAEDHHEEAQSPTALDPDVLSSLVVQLRTNLAELTQTRDDLLTSLSHSHAQEAELRDSLALSNERNEALSRELDQLREKSQADEDTISLLRQKVEESRRGLMRLQSEQRRQTLQPLSLDKSGSTSKASKRASFTPGTPFTPLTGSGRPAHRRVTSTGEVVFDETPSSPTNASMDISSHQSEGASSKSVKALNRMSGFFFSSPPTEPIPLSTSQEDVTSATGDSRQELKALKKELETAHARLAEASEAKEASDLCVKALRDFISEHRVGEAGQKLPPLPPEAEPKKIASGWSGFNRLWSSNAVPVVSIPPPESSPSSPEDNQPTAQASSFTQKLGGLFSRSTPTTAKPGPMMNGLGDSDSETTSVHNSNDLTSSPSNSLQRTRNDDENDLPVE